MSSPQGLSILVTGANGFMGGVIQDELEKLKVRVVSVVWPPLEEDEGQKDKIAIDLSTPTGLGLLDAVDRVDAIIHCAAILPGAIPDLDLLSLNQLMTYNLLKWGCKRKVSHFLFASRCCVYGLQSHPDLEKSPLFPTDLYAVSKISREQMMRIMMDGDDIPSCILRISAPYGPHSKAEMVVRRFFLSASQDLTISLLGSGNRSQDFVYEQDVTHAFCMAPAARVAGVFNLAGGQSVSIHELALTALDLFKRDSQKKIIFSGIDEQEEYRDNFPIDAAFQAFGYRPEIPIREGLKRIAQASGLL